MLLAEQFLLFQLDDDSGSPVDAYKGRTRRWPQDDVAGAIFLELALKGRLAMNSSEQLVVSNATSLSDSILAQALATFASAPPTKDYRKWFDNIGASHLQDLLSHRMVEQGMLREDWRRLHKLEVIEHIRNVIFGSTQLDQHTAALIVLLDVCWLMMGDIITNKEEKAYRKRFDQLFPDYLEWLADYSTDMGTVLLDGIARPNSNAMSAVLIALGNEFR
jgi:hypothetical protein